MNVNQKGNIGLIKVMSDLYNKGKHCFIPFDDHSPVDLISMDNNGHCQRWQVKYRSLDKKRNRYELAANSVVNGKKVAINRMLIDGWAVYLADEDRVVYLPINIMEGKGIHYIKPNEEYGELTERPKVPSC